MSDNITIIRSYKYRLYPNKTQQDRLDFAFWQGRQVWNEALGRINQSYAAPYVGVDDQGSAYPRSGVLCIGPHVEDSIDQIGKDFRALRTEKVRESWNFVPSETLTHILRRQLQPAIDAYWRKRKEGMFHKKAGWPHFKRRGEFNSLYYRWRGKAFPEHDGKWARVTLPNIGSVRFRYHRPIPDGYEVQNVIVKYINNVWYITLQIRNKESVVYPSIAKCSIGLDVGLVYALASNDGQTWPAPRWLEEELPELRRLQRKLDRQRRSNNPDNYCEDGTIKPGPKTWVEGSRQKRTQAQVTKLHRYIKDARWYWWHTITDWLTKEYSFIAIEDLSPQFMIHNPKLARRASDLAFSQGKAMLRYKCEERGVKLIEVNPAYTSQTCSECGCVDKSNRQTQPHFECIECGYIENADINAARNILARGIDVENNI